MSLVPSDNPLSVESVKAPGPISGKQRKPDSSRKLRRVGPPGGDFEINYEAVNRLLALEGLSQKHPSTLEAHDEFMKSYRSIFIKPERTSGIPVHSQKRSELRAIQPAPNGSDVSTGPTSGIRATLAAPVVPTSHDVRDYTKAYRKQKSAHTLATGKDSMGIIRKTLRKLPFERSEEEVDLLYKLLRSSVPDLVILVPRAKELRELTTAAVLDDWPDAQFTVFGSSGFHMILKGSVVAMTKPWLLPPTNSAEEQKRLLQLSGGQGSSSGRVSSDSYQNVVVDETPQTLLGVGDCFGTLTKLEGQPLSTKLLSVITNEPGCEFLKISCSDYERILGQIKTEDMNQKMNLIQACPSFQNWTAQPKIKLANILEWEKYGANKVIVREGYQAPFMGFIKAGECHVLKHLEVLKPLPDGSQAKRQKQVIMGKISTNQSFGEHSVMNEEPMACSIITATAVEIGVISPEELHGLDEVTKELLQQSCKQGLNMLAEDEIHSEYLSQELQREWNQFKHQTVVDVINSKGIMPGYGKWKK